MKTPTSLHAINQQVGGELSHSGVPKKGGESQGLTKPRVGPPWRKDATCWTLNVPNKLDADI